MNKKIADNYILSIDSLNALVRQKLSKLFSSETVVMKDASDEMCDYVEDLLIAAYITGHEDAAEMLGIDDIEVDYDKLNSSLNKTYDGIGYKERINEYIYSADTDSIIRVVETEWHRNYNKGGIDGAEEASSSFHTSAALTGQASDGFSARVIKKWVTMRDNRVRETHEYLEGASAALEENFYTFDGDYAPYPGAFQDASNNCGCRCAIDYEWDISN